MYSVFHNAIVLTIECCLVGRTALFWLLRVRKLSQARKVGSVCYLQCALNGFMPAEHMLTFFA
jgi:hypothetical protein